MKVWNSNDEPKKAEIKNNNNNKKNLTPKVLTVITLLVKSLPSAVQSAAQAAPPTDTSAAQSLPGTEAVVSILPPQTEPEEPFVLFVLQRPMQKHTSADK